MEIVMTFNDLLCWIIFLASLIICVTYVLINCIVKIIKRRFKK